MHILHHTKTRFPEIGILAYQLEGTKISGETDKVNKVLHEVKEYLDETPDYFDSKIIKEYERIAHKSCGRSSKVYTLARLLQDNAFPRNNSFTDLLNALQVYEGVVASVYDLDKITGGPVLDIGKKGEEVTLDDSVFVLSGRELILRDEKRVMTIIPSFDTNYFHIGNKTDKILVVLFGNKYLKRRQLIDIMDNILGRIFEILGGRVNSFLFID